MIFQPWVLQLPAWSTVGRLSSALVRWFVGSLVRSLFGLPFSHEEARGTSKNSTLGVSRNHESQHFEEQTRMDA